jgi:hypothetical protein
MKHIKTFESFLNENYLFEAKDPMKSPIKTMKTKQTLAYFAQGGLHNLPGKKHVKQVAEVLGVDAFEIFYNNLANPTMLDVVEMLQNNAKFTKVTGMKKSSSDASETSAEYTFKKGKYKGVEFVAEFRKYPDEDEATISFIWMSRDAAEELAKEF